MRLLQPTVVFALVFFSMEGKTESIDLFREDVEVVFPTSCGSSFDPTEYLVFLHRFITPNDLVFDVGANIGKNAQLYLDSGARVVCFEPQPECVKVLQERFQNYPSVAIEPIGLGEQEGKLEMYISSLSPTISTFSFDYTLHSRFADRGSKWDKKIMVPIATLDQMIQKHGLPAYCKIDVENFELEVLRGLTQPIPLISFECNTDQLETSKKCLAYLQMLGYQEFNYGFGERGYFISPVWLSADELLGTINHLMETTDFSAIWGLWGDIYARR